MKRLLFTVFSIVLLLFGCSTQETPSTENNSDKNQQQQETQQLQETNSDANSGEVEQPQNNEINVDQVREIIEEYALTDGDKIIDLSVENNEIKAVIELAESVVPLKDIAITVYSAASDELLNHEGWEVLTIKFEGVGTVSMNRSEHETNDFGMPYFPRKEIEKNLN